PDAPLVVLDPADAARLGAAAPDVEDVLPLAPLQEGLLFHAGVDAGGGDAYVVQLLLDLDGPVDAAALSGAARAVLRRHPALRAAFRHTAEGTPVQVVVLDAPLDVQVIDVAAGPDQEARARRIADEERERPFDPGEAPLLRLALLRLGPQRFLLVLTVHHLVVDGWSLPVLVRELLALHAGGEGTGLAPVRPYRDWLAWAADQDRAASLAAWGRALAGLSEPTVVCGVDAAAVTGATRVTGPERVSEVDLDEDATAEVRAFARHHGLTLNTVVQGAWGMVLGMLTGSHDVVFGATVAGRPAELAGVESMVGLFVNTVPVRVRVEPGAPVASWLAGLQAEQAQLMAHHHVPLAAIQQVVGVGPLFDTLVVFENYPLDADGLAGAGPLTVRAVERRDATHYPLCLSVVPGRRLTLRLAHRPGLVEPGLADRIAGWVARALEALVAGPERPVGAVEVVPAEERAGLLADGYGPVRDVPVVTLPELFEAQASRRPADVALVAGGTALTYAELNARANRLARLLAGTGAGPEDVVALALPRTEELVVGLLAVLKAGAAVLALNTDDPAERLARQLADARPAGVVATRATAGVLPDGCRPLVLDEPSVRAELARCGAGDLGDGDGARPLGLDTPAYVISTSGSTGAPKAVVVPHGALTNLFHAQLADLVDPEVRAAGGRRLRAALVAPAVFDAFWEPVLWMVAGHELHLMGDEVRLDPERLVEEVRGRRIDVVDTTPSHLAPLLAAGLLDAGRHRPAVVTFGGEAAGAALWSALRAAAPAVRAYNFYGPTECTVDALWCAVADRSSPAIGRPLANVRAHVLDAALR
ncbi:MAG: condensation domain-containing protein, partial [Actinomycetota bacterium]|nr:condensation domain-containing protein [Actinomycetota bacterium]